MGVAEAAVGAGVVLVGVAAALARRVARIDAELKAFEIEKVRISRWVTASLASYRPAGWPLLTRLRLCLAFMYIAGILGVLLLAYGCPALSR